MNKTSFRSLVVGFIFSLFFSSVCSAGFLLKPRDPSKADLNWLSPISTSPTTNTGTPVYPFSAIFPNRDCPDSLYVYLVPEKGVKQYIGSFRTETTNTARNSAGVELSVMDQFGSWSANPTYVTGTVLNNAAFKIKEMGSNTFSLTCGWSGTFHKTITLQSYGYIGTGYAYGSSVYLSLTPTFGIDLQPGTSIGVSIVGVSDGMPYAWAEGLLTHDPYTTMPLFQLKVDLLPIEETALRNADAAGIKLFAVLRVGLKIVGVIHQIDLYY